MDERNKTTVLVVEDETLVRMHGMDILAGAGFTVLEAADADETQSTCRGSLTVSNSPGLCTSAGPRFASS